MGVPLLPPAALREQAPLHRRAGHRWYRCLAALPFHHRALQQGPLSLRHSDPRRLLQFPFRRLVRRRHSLLALARIFGDGTKRAVLLPIETFGNQLITGGFHAPLSGFLLLFLALTDHGLDPEPAEARPPAPGGRAGLFDPARDPLKRLGVPVSGRVDRRLDDLGLAFERTSRNRSRRGRLPRRHSASHAGPCRHGDGDRLHPDHARAAGGAHPACPVHPGALAAHPTRRPASFYRTGALARRLFRGAVPRSPATRRDLQRRRPRLYRQFSALQSGLEMVGLGVHRRRLHDVRVPACERTQGLPGGGGRRASADVNFCLRRRPASARSPR